MKKRVFGTGEGWVKVQSDQMLILYVATTPFIKRTPTSHNLKEKFFERETTVELIKEMSNG